MNVDIDSYMGSRYEDPFYTHLHIIPEDGYEAQPLRLATQRKR
jgi:phage gp36-like protein